MGRPGPADVPVKTSWRAKAAVKKECTVFQVVWTVYVHGRKYCIVFHMVQAHFRPLYIDAKWVHGGQLGCPAIEHVYSACIEDRISRRHYVYVWNVVHQPYTMNAGRRVPAVTSVILKALTKVVVLSCAVLQTQSHSEARLQINGVEVLRRKYKLWQQVWPVAVAWSPCCAQSEHAGGTSSFKLAPRHSSRGDFPALKPWLCRRRSSTSTRTRTAWRSTRRSWRRCGGGSCGSRCARAWPA